MGWIISKRSRIEPARTFCFALYCRSPQRKRIPTCNRVTSPYCRFASQINVGRNAPLLCTPTFPTIILSESATEADFAYVLVVSQIK